MNCDCFLCTHCMTEWKSAIVASRQILRYKKGGAIFREGEPVEGLHFIRSGAVKVHQAWGSDKELILHFASSGDVIGHRAQGGQTTYPISATALEPTEICFISNTFLEATLKTNPSFLYRMMQLYAGELQKAEKRMRNLALMEVKGRIADALLTIRDTFWLDDGGYIRVPVTRQDIASYAGTTYETVFKLFTEWTASGLIETNGKNIKIKDSKALKKFIQH